MMEKPQLILLFASSSSLFILLLFHFIPSSVATSCTPSACGHLRNISQPFRLKHDPKHCGDHKFELTCENDVASLSFNSHKHYVKEINYLNSSITIRLSDASIHNTDSCSFPSYSLYESNFSNYVFDNKVSYPYLTTATSSRSRPFEDVAWPVNLMSCRHPLKNSSTFTETTGCRVPDSSKFGFTYVKVGHMNASEVPESCRLDVIAMTSWEFRDLKNVSLSEIHDSLLYGFQLTPCMTCLPRGKFAILRFTFWPGIFIPVLAILGLVCAAVSPPVFTIAGFVAVSVLLYESLILLASIILYPQAGYSYFQLLCFIIALVMVVFILALRIILFPVAVCFLIYIFRRRHLSMYSTIETFLQSDNKLMPIRYSYFEIKKITRSFRHKLGEGGYGSVFKGKLQSGCDVAVKLLRKSGVNGQDFINEIATIGRIHHVNIIKLLGYCVQGSKYALIFDFMSNGSLEKYLFNTEEGKSLNLDTKLEIAIGIARGIEYLHKGCDVQILHFDIKPHNILLDENFIPKISDFGLAKLCSTNKTTVSMTAARGTIGYVAPELISRSIGPISHKADVYSFGMLLIEMVSLKRDLIGNNGDSEKYFPYWIYDCLKQGKDIGIETVNENNASMRRFARKMTIVALWCIQMNPQNRPSMNKVLEMLECVNEDLQIPNPPSESFHFVVNVDYSESGIAHSTDSIPLLSHDDGLPCMEISVEE